MHATAVCLRTIRCRWPQHFVPPNTAVAAQALKDVKVGTRIIMGIALTMGVDKAVYDGSPVVMEGKVTAWSKSTKRACVAWAANPDGQRPSDSNETLAVHTGVGSVNEFKNGCLADGHWAVYTGAQSDAPFRILSLALRQGQRDELGRQRTMFRVRIRGLSPEVDWVASQADIERVFPVDAPSMLLEASAWWRALSP